ncbi:phage head-tail connector protein [Clostridium baratii]|uniref:phage head-tail connector protein n=1 Tax=Clostridium baratii TaxID=1561 RepID=UPI0030D4D0D8
MLLPIDKLKLRLPDADKKLLNQLLEDAESEILDFCNRDVLLDKMEGLQRELAIIYYNRMGSEGESSRSEGGVSVSYSTEIPENIKSRLMSYRRLKAVGIANANKK